MPIRIIEDFYNWKTVVEVPVIEKFFPDIFRETTALYVGVRPLGWGGCPEPNSLATYLNRAVSQGGIVVGLEAWPRYCELLRKNGPLWLSAFIEADICDLKTRIQITPKRFPLVIWWHGPEHAKTEKDLEMGLANCEALSTGHVLLGTPWSETSSNVTFGGFEGEPENPYEAHGFQPSAEWLSERGYEVIALNCRRPEEKDKSVCGHLVCAKGTL
jgi:hypothetical protein